MERNKNMNRRTFLSKGFSGIFLALLAVPMGFFCRKKGEPINTSDHDALYYKRLAG